MLQKRSIRWRGFTGQRPDGTFDETLIANAHDGWANWDIHVSARFISVIQAGEVASVLGLDVNDDPARSWLDIHSLLRVDGT